jgi:hypothetical protein
MIRYVWGFIPVLAAVITRTRVQPTMGQNPEQQDRYLFAFEYIKYHETYRWM